jgi:hypothetical protein
LRSKDILFFCDCGCKVFFDELGSDWPIHDCIGYNKLNAQKAITTELIKKDKKVSWTFVTADEIDGKYKERITEIVKNIDIGKTFTTKNNNSFGASLLKEFQKGSYHQTTIHTINIKEKNKDSYTTLILDFIMKGEKILKEDNVIVNLIGKEILDLFDNLNRSSNKSAKCSAFCAETVRKQEFPNSSINRRHCNDIKKLSETI